MKKPIILLAVGVLFAVIGYTLFKPKGESERILPTSGVNQAKKTIVFLGDSVTAGYGVESRQAFPYLIGEYWKENNIYFNSRNEGISGDTTNGVLSRLDNALTDDVYMVFLEIGANDAFAKTDVKVIKSNLKAIIQRIQDRQFKVVIMAMDLPKVAYLNDENYVKSFVEIYEEVGKELNVPVMPSFVKENDDKKDMWQEDGIHPSPRGHELLASKVLKFLNI